MTKINNYCCSRQAGFTLVEVLIAAVIASFTLAAAFEVFRDHNKGHILQARISDMQQNGRASLDELVQKIRQAGYRVPIGAPSLQAWDTNPDSIAICFLHEPLCTASLSDPMPLPSSELKLTDSDVGCFEDDTWAYIYDPTTETGEFFLITHVQAAAGHIQHNTMPLSKVYPASSELFMMEFLKYYIDSSDVLHPTMMIQKNGGSPEIYADNIEELQFQYTMADGTVLDTITVDRYVREVSISVTARTSGRDLMRNDGDYRREAFNTKVNVRNLGM